VGVAPHSPAALFQRVRWVDDDLVRRGDAAENLQRGAVIASDVDRAQLHLAVGTDDGDARPSARKSIAFTGIVTLFTLEPTAKCTSPNEPGSKRPSLLGTSTSVSRVRVAGSIASAVRATFAEKLLAGNSCKVTAAWRQL
jgi:hypothetical protein